jgi:hypothetical protein
MQWWNDFLNWFSSDNGWRVFSTAILPFIAIVVAGTVAAMVGRASTRRVIALSDREQRIAAVTTLLSAARRASVWNTLSAGEQPAAEQAAIDAEIRLRLLSIPGAGMASEWVAHEIADMRRNSVSFSFQAEQTLLVVRDRLIEWQARPSRAKKLFKNDLDTWAYESSLSDQDLVHQQKAWSAQQTAASTAPTAAQSSAATPASGSSVPPARSSLAPSLSDPAVQESAATPSEPPKDGLYSRPVSATDASKRIDPPHDDDTI